MPIHSKDIVEIICTLSEEEKLRVAVKESLKGGVIAGIGAATGGILLGPIGLAIGSAVGGCFAAYVSQGKFVPAVEIIATLPERRREKLVQNVRHIMETIDITDVAVFAALITGDLSVRQRVLQTVVDYLRHELSLTLIEKNILTSY